MQTVCVGIRKMDERFENGNLVQLLRTMEFGPFFFLSFFFASFSPVSRSKRNVRSKKVPLQIVNACGIS